MKVKNLSEEQLERYSRQIIMNEIGLDGQLLLINSSILIIGCGGLGTAALSYLSMAGIGRLGIIDFDKVAVSNLNRQILFDENDIGRSKVITAKKKNK